MFDAAADSPSASRPLCCHCHQHVVTRPRGLCWACFHDPGVREKYPSAFGSISDRTGDLPLPADGTDAVPGSAEKVVVLGERARLRTSLWHPADAPMDLESRRLGVG